MGPGTQCALCVILLAAVATARSAGAATIDPLSPTTAWLPLDYAISTPDPGSDQGTGDAQGDIVGDADNPAAYVSFDDAGTADPTDGNVGFRVRLGADTNPPGFDSFLMVGLDADADGALDIILGADFQGSPDELGIYLPGTGLNTSPNTTSIQTPPLFSFAPTVDNYAWSAVDSIIDPGVTNTDLDGGGSTDHFLTFVLPFADVVSALSTAGVPGVDDGTPLSIVIGTANQPNALNQDIGGTSEGWSSQLPWDQLGAISIPFELRNAPEPGTGALTAFGLLWLAAARTRRRRAC